MAVRLDHLVIAVDDLQLATDAYTAMGFTVLPGGRHSAGTTENALIVFADGSYLELIGFTGDAPQPTGTDFAAMLGNRRGLAGVAFAVDDLKAHAATLRARSISVGALSSGQRVTPTGDIARWQMTFLNPTMAPFFIEDLSPRNVRVPDRPNAITHTNGASGVAAITVLTDDLTSGESHYAALLAASPKPENAGCFFSLANGTDVHLRIPKNEAERAHRRTHGDAPFSMTIATTAPLPDNANPHGARLAFDVRGGDA